MIHMSSSETQESPNKDTLKKLAVGGAIAIGVAALAGARYLLHIHHKQLKTKHAQTWSQIIEFIKCKKNNSKHIQTLINNKQIAINARDPIHGYTLLMWCAVYGSVPTARMLIEEYKADIEAKNQQNQSALDIAKHERQFNIIDLLLEKGIVDDRPMIMNQLLGFDVICKDSKQMSLAFDGTTIRKNPNSINCDIRSVCFASSFGWSYGLNEFRVKCIKPGVDAIGIITDISYCSQLNAWFADIDYGEAAYCWIGQKGVYGVFDGVCQKIVSGDAGFEVDDIVRVVVDCQRWMIIFYKNDEKFHSMEIQKNRTYYPIINLQASSDTTIYKLL